MKTKLMALLLLAGSTMFAGPRFYFGVGVGGYGPAPRYYVAPYVAPPPVYVAPVPVPVYYRPAYYYVARPPFVAPDVPYAGKSVQTIDVTPSLLDWLKADEATRKIIQTLH